MRHSGLMDNLEVERRSLVEMVSTGTRPFSVGEPMTLHVAPLRSDRATSEWSVARLPTGGACTLTFDIVRGEQSRRWAARVEITVRAKKPRSHSTHESWLRPWRNRCASAPTTSRAGRAADRAETSARLQVSKGEL